MTTFVLASPNIYVLGDSGVGKSTLLQTYQHQEKPTSGYIDSKVDNLTRTLDVNGKPFTFTVRDTYTTHKSIQEILDKIAQVDLFILCYEVSSRETFSNVEKHWGPALREKFGDVPILLTGLKRDKADGYSVTEAEAFEVGRRFEMEGFTQLSSFEGNKPEELQKINSLFSEAYAVSCRKITLQAKKKKCCLIL